jgi:hypothetical protein
VRASPEAEGVGGGERCVYGFGERNCFGGRCVNGGERGSRIEREREKEKER